MGKQQCSDSSSPETEAQVWNTVTLGKYSWCTSLCNRGPAGTQLPQGYLIWVSKTIKDIINNSQPGINTYNPIKSFWWCQKPRESTQLPGGKIKIHPWRNYSPEILCLPCQRPSSTSALSMLLLFSFQAFTDFDAFCTSAEREKDQAPDCRQQNRSVPAQKYSTGQKKKQTQTFFCMTQGCWSSLQTPILINWHTHKRSIESRAMTRVSKACTN